MDDKYYLLFSDGIWNIAYSFEEIDTIIQKHWWPFPLDKKGDWRRKVQVFPANGISFSQLRENI